MSHVTPAPCYFFSCSIEPPEQCCGFSLSSLTLSVFFLGGVCACVRVCGGGWMKICVCMSRCLYTCLQSTGEQRLMLNDFLITRLPYLFLEVGSLTEPEAHQSA